ncbi:hypothetical protein ANABIO32_02370 [Rossellomorea marisflavi]|nr:hypothetical protein ANABIO32_02370 [Rossellomorea marisflavi]
MLILNIILVIMWTALLVMFVVDKQTPSKLVITLMYVIIILNTVEHIIELALK